MKPILTPKPKQRKRPTEIRPNQPAPAKKKAAPTGNREPKTDKLKTEDSTPES